MDEAHVSPTMSGVCAASRLEIPLIAGQQTPAAASCGTVTAFRYGAQGAGPKAYLQAGLHADEFPGMLALHLLRARLDEAAAEGRVRGEILILPQANPLGLAQWVEGFLLGRVDAAGGGNFNRDYPDLGALVPSFLAEQPGSDAARNVTLIRAAMRMALAAQTPRNPAEALRRTLLSLACDADLVLDLHADNEALPHLYTEPAFWPELADVAAGIGAHAVLLAECSGGHPFDEACGAPWAALAARFPGCPIPRACVAATLELGSNDTVDAALAARQADAVFAALSRRGMVSGAGLAAEPGHPVAATPLEAMQQLRAPAGGLVIYHRAPGSIVRKGDVVATVLDPLDGPRDGVPVLAETDGTLFARHSQTYAWPGKIIGKIAGQTPLAGRSGHLLTD